MSGHAGSEDPESRGSGRGEVERSGGPGVETWSGDGGTRTRDFLLAKQVLYQLSYVPASPDPTC
jgi:hypothetical protein